MNSIYGRRSFIRPIPYVYSCKLEIPLDEPLETGLTSRRGNDALGLDPFAVTTGGLGLGEPATDGGSSMTGCGMGDMYGMCSDVGGRDWGGAGFVVGLLGPARGLLIASLFCGVVVCSRSFLVRLASLLGMLRFRRGVRIA